MITNEYCKRIMTKKKLTFIYNATCEWCFGYTKLLDIVSSVYGNSIEINIVSGGFPIKTQNFILKKYDTRPTKQFHSLLENVEISKNFDYLKHKSFSPAVAMVVFKERFPEKSLQFALRMQNLILIKNENSDEAISKIADELGFNENDFLTKIAENKYQELAYYEYEYFANKFNLKNLPATILSSNKLEEVVFNGYICINKLKQIFENENQLITN
jgi:putative protein-disulfide isomerase